LCVNLWGANPVPGFNGLSPFRVFNPGTTIQPAAVTLEYTTLIDFTNSTPAPTSIDEENGIVTWDLGNIYPNSSSIVDINFYTDPSVELGEEVTLTATLGDLVTDSNPENNSASQTKEVIGSYDPNDKQVTPSGTGENNQIDPLTDELTYKVRFQNTGTAPAVNVVIEDVIDINTLDIQSLEVINTSHNLTDIMFDENRVLFAFENIMLPDSTSNLEASQGFINFKIKVIEGLPLGTVIENSAAIFFDFNEPIITNTAFVTLDQADNVLEQLDTELSVFPNPTNGNLSITSGEELDSFQLLDMTGRLVFESAVNSKRIDLSFPAHLENGVYILRLNSGEYAVVREVALQR